MTESASAWTTYRRLVRLAASYKALLIIGAVALGFEAPASAGFTKLMQPVIHASFANEAVGSPWPLSP